jgi:hypothetical protein
MLAAGMTDLSLIPSSQSKPDGPFNQRLLPSSQQMKNGKTPVIWQHVIRRRDTQHNDIQYNGT